MRSAETRKRAKELIERAKSLSKEKIAAFCQEQYGMDPSLLEELWVTPIISTGECEELFFVQLENVGQDEMGDKIAECVDAELGDEPMAVIPTSDIISELPFEAINEYDSKVESGEIVPELDCAIVYDEEALVTMYEEHIEAGTEAGYLKEQIEGIFLEDIAKHFTHERIHVITNKLIITYQDSEKIGLEDYNPVYQDDSEVLIDTLARIISAHEPGQSIEDDLEKTLKDRKNILQRRQTKSYYSDKEDTLVTAIYALFPQELSRWIMFDARDTNIPNQFIAKCDEVLGSGTRPRGEALFNKVGDCFNESYTQKLEPNQLSKTQQLLELVGVRNICLQYKVSKEALKKIAFSEEAMEEIVSGARVVQYALDVPNKEAIDNIE